VTGLIRQQVGTLAGVLADLKARVRVALAGEIARAVAGAVEEVVRAVVAGRREPVRPAPAPASYRPPPTHWDDGDDGWGRARHPWDDRDRDDWDDGQPARPGPVPPDAPTPPPAVPTAVAAGVHVARWWLARRGNLVAAAGAGMAVGLLGLAGGPAVRTAVAALAAVADLVAATDALGDGAARLARP
jgi:hypothetical protein